MSHNHRNKIDLLLHEFLCFVKWKRGENCFEKPLYWCRSTGTVTFQTLDLGSKELKISSISFIRIRFYLICWSIFVCLLLFCIENFEAALGCDMGTACLTDFVYFRKYFDIVTRRTEQDWNRKFFRETPKQYW